MTASDNKQIINEVKKVSDSITYFAEKAQSDFLLQCYSNSDNFLAFSSDGKMRKYEEFKNLCTRYYVYRKIFRHLIVNGQKQTG